MVDKKTGAKIKQILDAREERVEQQEKWQREYNLPCVSVRCNYPGTDKNNSTSKKVIEEIAERVVNALGQIAAEKSIDSHEGPIRIFFVEGEATEIKKLMVSIEKKHPYGRLVDIDIYDEDGGGISRRDMGIPPRKCYICEREAHLCVRSRRHGIDDIIRYIEDKVWGE